ncbi:apolipoprotein B receptor isoform X5 [Mus musculus]|uniref:apolipoprotein B receptor isoform X5 n=1 Tax=Mus musculus TaxID=10090 RepID=UPI00167A4A62|nr:apolipoprotein B receptor isoform X5 [Mus musculus]
MDFLRLRLPGLHQALRGALDSFSAFVSYLVGDTVPTVERQTQAAEELGEVTEGKVVGEEAQEVLEGLRSGQSEGVEAPEETRRCQEGSLAGEQTWGWRADSSARPQAERQDTGSWKAAEDARGQEPSVPLKPEAEPGTHRDRSSNTAQEIWEHGEEEASSGEPLRTCEQKEEEEEVVRAAESGMAEGVESQPTWHSEPGGNAGTEGQHVTEDSKEIDWVAKDMVAEIEWFGAKGIDKEEERMVPMRDGERARAQGTQCPGAESEDQAMLSREAWTVSDREGADSLGVQGTEYGSDPGDNFPGTTGRVWVLEEADKGDQQDEVDEKREAEVRFPIQTLEAERTGEMTEGHIAEEEAMGEQETEGSFEDEERQDLAIRDNGVSLEEEVRAEESSREKRNSWATEPTLVLDTEAKDEPDWEDSPEVSTEELFVGERSEAAQMTPEALLPGSRLDVSVPRSRVLLSRSSSRRRSRPSFHRISVPEPQCDPPSPQPQAERPVPEQSSLQLEETPEVWLCSSWHDAGAASPTEPAKATVTGPRALERETSQESPKALLDPGYS